MNPPSVPYTLSDDINNSVKNWTPYIWTTKSGSLWSVQVLICCQYFKRSDVNNANRPSVCSRRQENFPWDAQRCPGSQQSRAMGLQSVLAVCGTFSCILGLPHLGQTSFFSSCCSEALLMPAATGCCKRQKIPRKSSPAISLSQTKSHWQENTESLFISSC